MRVSIDWGDGHSPPPEHDRWLSDPELAELSAWCGSRREASRRARWRLRRLAGSGVWRVGGEGPRKLTEANTGESLSASISHAGGVVAVALADGPHESVGCDVVTAEPLPGALIKTWMTRSEQAWIRQSASPVAASLGWALKEALYKTGRHGESFQPAKIDVLNELSRLGLPTPRLDAPEERAACPSGEWRITIHDARLVAAIAITSSEATDRRPAA